MTGKTRKTTRCLALIMSAATVPPAHAMIPVFDIPNFFVNLGIKAQLIGIRHQLENKTEEGTVNYNTMWIDKSTRSIDLSTTNIDNSTHQIDITTTSILDYTVKNYDIDTSFTWIINNNGGEIIPIPKPVKEKLEAILDSKTIDQYTGNYKMASDFGTQLPEGGYDAAIEGSRSRKAANDALVMAVSEDQASLESELAGLNALRDKAKSAPQGQGHQLQVANALSASQVNQMMKLRSMMVASEAARAAEAQVAADKDARAIAIGKHMRIGLDDAASHSIAPRATY